MPQAATTTWTPVPSGILQRKCACGTHTIAGGECEACKRKQAQTKLVINQPGDRYEQEADRTADAVMSISEVANQQSPFAVTPVQAAQVSRACADSDKGMCATRMSEDTDVESEVIEETEGEFLQTKKRADHVAKPNSDTESSIQAMRGQGQPLPVASRSFFEPRFGHDFSHVRVHAGGEATSAARSMNARAFTVGHDIVFGANEFAPETTTGQRLLAHELTHVLQQRHAISNDSVASIQMQPKSKKEPPPKKEGDKDKPKDKPKEKPKAQLRFNSEAEARATFDRLKKLEIEVDEPVEVNKRWVLNFRRLSKAEAKAKAEEKKKNLATGLTAGTDYDNESDSYYVKILLKCPEGVPAKTGFHIWPAECFLKKDQAEALKQKLIEGYGSAELYQRADAAGFGVYYKAITDQDLTKQQAAATKQLESEKGQPALKKCPDGFKEIGNFLVTTYHLPLEKEFSDKAIKTDPCGLKGKFRDEFLSHVVVEGSGVSIAGDFIQYDHCNKQRGSKCSEPCYRISPCPETKTGTCAKIGRSVAVDPKVIPLGSELFIEGVGLRTAEDTGGSIDGKHIDVYRGLISAVEANKLTMPGKPKVCMKSKK